MYFATAVHVGPHVPQEAATQRRPLLVRLRRHHAVEALHRELRVDRHQPAAQADHRIHHLAVPEAVLEAIVLRRQDLRQQVLQQQLPEPAADLRRLQDVLQLPDVLPHLQHLLARRLQPPELLPDAPHRLRRRRERLVHRLLHRVQARRQPLVQPLDATLQVLLRHVQHLRHVDPRVDPFRPQPLPRQQPDDSDQYHQQDNHQRFHSACPLTCHDPVSKRS